MGDDKGHLAVGSCHYDKHLLWGGTLPLLFRVVQKSVQRNISKEKHKQPGKKLRNNGIHCCIFMWFLHYLNHCSGATRPMGPSDKVQSKELCSGPLCHLLSEILGNHLIFLTLSVLNPMSKARWENAYKFSKVI